MVHFEGGSFHQYMTHSFIASPYNFTDDTTLSARFDHFLHY